MILCGQEFAAAIDRSVFPGQQGGPLMHIIAAKAVAFGEALQPEFKEYARQTVANAKVLAERHGRRRVSDYFRRNGYASDAGGCVCEGHSGSEAEAALGEAGITVNKNAIPFDVNPPMKPSGIRIGSPALTTRGMKEAEMRRLRRGLPRRWRIVRTRAGLRQIRGQVLELANQFPLYGWKRNKA